MTPIPITLHYFPICGRAQPLRHALLDAGVRFEDARIPLPEWPQRREDPRVAGAYRGLPTLRWGEELICETLPIASYLARRLGHYEGFDLATTARHEAVVSCCYVEVTLPVGHLIWAELAWPGVQLERAFPLHLSRMLDKLALLDSALPDEAFLGGATPTMADFYADEAFATLRCLLGPAREARLQERLPRLACLYHRMSARPRLSRIRQDRPERYTSQPDEQGVLARLHAMELSSLGL